MHVCILNLLSIAACFRTCFCNLSQLTVKILGQKRTGSLARLLASLEAANYPRTANIDLEIYIDQISSVGVLPGSHAIRQDSIQRQGVLEISRIFADGWSRGNTKVIEMKAQKGIRGMWLSCAVPGHFGEEFARFVIIEDDIELSPVWLVSFNFVSLKQAEIFCRFEYLAAAHGAYLIDAGIAGISLQRQTARTDGYASEISDRAKRLGVRQTLASLGPSTAPGTSYLFPHVGSWGFSPNPGVWNDFLNWFDNLQDVDAQENWVSRVNYGGPERETLPSRWYRQALNTKRGELFVSRIGTDGRPSSMWTAHFDAYCARQGLLVLYPHLFELSDQRILSEVGLARSWREDGAHYNSINKPDGHLLGEATWRNEFLSGKQMDLFPRSQKLARLTHGGNRLSNSALRGLKQQYLTNYLGLSMDAVNRRLSDLDVYWELDDPLALNDLPQAVTGDTFGYYDPLVTVTQEQAQCILGGKSVVILGDSISRYFAFQFNNFLINGDIAAEWGSFAGGCTKWGCGVKEGNCYIGPYFDCGTTWNEGTDRSDSSSHRQYITSTIDAQKYGDIKTTFYFIQDTWYGELEQEASTIREYDVIIANSGWWELKDDENEDHKSDSCSFSNDNDVSDFYRDSDCLDSYEDDLKYLVSGIFRYFVNDDDKAAVWRAVTCCGVDDSNNKKQRIGAIAVGAMNTIAEKVMSDNSVDVVPVYQLSNIMNLGTGQGDGRTFDGFHPRSNQMQIWTQLCLNKISKQLKKTEACLAATPSSGPTMRPVSGPTGEPTTSHPSLVPVPRPSNSPTSNPTLQPSTALPTTAKPSDSPTTAAPTSLTCRNGVRDGTESDIDCGGGACNKCGFGLNCEWTSDCQEGVCNGNICDPRPSASPTELPTAIPASIPTSYPSSASPTAPMPTMPLPSPIPTEYPVANPTTAAPAVITPRPTKIPRPWPTKHPTIWVDPDADTGFSYGGSENVRKASSCVSSNDGITYKNKPALDFTQCPTTGQKVLLAILIASLFSYASALALRPRTKGSNYRTFQTSRDRTTGPFASSKPSVSRLEDELSNSALQVLRQMEDIEVRSGPTQLASVAECDEENDEPGATIKTHHVKDTLHSASRCRVALNRSGMQAGSIRDGSSYAPRTSISLVNKTFSISAASTRTSSYAEPHLDTKVSSVAFSFYDGGDSDEEEEMQPKVNYLDRMLASNWHQTYETARTALEFGFLLGICVIGEHRMPSGVLPAGTTLAPENPDMWCFIMALVFLGSLLNIEVLEAGAEVFLSRAQANEWKGWMQVAFVAYHYTNNNDIYVPIRWCVSAYVWLTGFGNGVYFWSSADFSFKRYAQQLWRMNFLCLFLSLATGTPWIEYYFVALATVHFTLIWISLALARAFGCFVAGWEKPNKKENQEACYSEKACGCIIMIGLCSLIWLDPHDDGRGIYDVLFRPCLIRISEYFEWYFWMRTKMDFLSSIPGLCFAAVYKPFRDAWPYGVSRMFCFGIGAVSSILLISAIWVSQLSQYCCHGGADYRIVNPYIGTLWIPSYLLARNSSPWLSRRIMKPIEWIGMHSLEFYLLQFHVFLTSASRRILYLIPKENWGYTNMCLMGFIYFVVVLKALEVTNVLRKAAWRASRPKVTVSILWTIAAYATLTDVSWDGAKCSRPLWGVWSLWCALAICMFTYWTVREDGPTHIGIAKEPPSVFQCPINFP